MSLASPNAHMHRVEGSAGWISWRRVDGEARAASLDVWDVHALTRELRTGEDLAQCHGLWFEHGTVVRLYLSGLACFVEGERRGGMHAREPANGGRNGDVERRYKAKV
jgi:hypothetical protein